jgi:hypothetical protein
MLSHDLMHPTLLVTRLISIPSSIPEDAERTKISPKMIFETYQNCGKLSPLSRPLSSSSRSRSRSLPPCFAVLHPAAFVTYCGVLLRLSGAGLVFLSLTM